MVVRRRSLLAAAACAAAVAVACPAVAGAAALRGGPAAGRAGEPKPFLDVREARRAAVRRRGDESLRPPGPATRRERRALGPGAILEVDELTGTPRVLARRGGTLTGPRAGDRAEIAAAWVREHLPELGLTRDDLGSLGRPERAAAPGGGQRIRWRQHVDGIPAFDNGLRVTVTADGRVLSALGSPDPGLDLATATPASSAGEALRALMDDVGVRRPVEVASGPAGPTRRTRFAGGDSASLVVFGEGTRARLGWQVLYRATPLAWYAAVVDAETGAVLYRSNLVRHVNAQVWEQYPGAPQGGAQAAVSIGDYLDPGATELEGPNAVAWPDVNDNDIRDDDPDERVAPGGYLFDAFTSAENPAGACGAAPRCSWNADVAGSWQANRDQNAVQAFYFANRFHDHLAAAPIGFDAADGNFEGADPVEVHTSDGAAGTTARPGLPDGRHVNNANMATPPDGASPTMQMYLFARGTDEPFRDVNGGDDAAIVYHEYTHGLSSRLVTEDGTPRSPQALNRPQPMAMAEGWSDWYAKDFLVGRFPASDTPAHGEVHMGAYVDSVPNSIRTEGLDCPVGVSGPACPGTASAGPGGYTYGDFNRVGGRSVHANGEIWSQTLWDLRGAVGSEVARGIVTEGMRQSPPEPSFLDMRDAILVADQLAYGGSHRQAIWNVFAARGMGWDAADGDPRLVEDFHASPNQPPSGSIAASPADAVTGQVVTLTAAVADPDGTIAEYAWDFDGNGVVDRVTAGQSTTTAYAAPGAYAAGVVARDDRGGTASAATAVTVRAPVTPPPPAPAPPPAPLAGLAPIVQLPGTGRAFKVRFVVRCDSACSGTARITVSRRVARRLRLGRSRTVATVRVRLPAAGRRRVSATLSFKARRGIRRARLRRIAATVRVAVVDAELQRGTARRGVRVAR